jgi:hypothetical protein
MYREKIFDQSHSDIYKYLEWSIPHHMREYFLVYDEEQNKLGGWKIKMMLTIDIMSILNAREKEKMAAMN